MKTSQRKNVAALHHYRDLQELINPPQKNLHKSTLWGRRSRGEAEALIISKRIMEVCTGISYMFRDVTASVCVCVCLCMWGGNLWLVDNGLVNRLINPSVAPKRLARSCRECKPGCLQNPAVWICSVACLCVCLCVCVLSVLKGLPEGATFCT